MELTFLGTGAADWPQIREDGFHRYLSSALIDRFLLIDPGPCIFSFDAEQPSSLLKDVTHVILTHSHSDHYSPEALLKLCNHHPITFYASEALLPLLPSSPNLSFVPISPYNSFHIRDYTLLPLPAGHSTSLPGEQPVHYIISKESKVFFYGLDGAWFPNKTFNIMKNYAFDCMVFDCTSGDIDGEYRIFEHNTIPMLEYMLNTIRISFPSMLKPSCPLIASHMARTLHNNHEMLSKRLQGFGMLAAYDGYSVTF